MQPIFHVFVVSDDDIDVAAFRRAFKKRDIKTHLVHFESGADILHSLRTNISPENTITSIVIVDVDLHDMTGLELLEEIKNDTALKNTISFVLTNSFSPDERKRSIQSGAVGYFLKTEIEELTNILGDILKAE